MFWNLEDRENKANLNYLSGDKWYRLSEIMTFYVFTFTKSASFRAQNSEIGHNSRSPTELHNQYL